MYFCIYSHTLIIFGFNIVIMSVFRYHYHHQSPSISSHSPLPSLKYKRFIIVIIIHNISIFLPVIMMTFIIIATSADEESISSLTRQIVADVAVAGFIQYSFVVRILNLWTSGVYQMTKSSGSGSYCQHGELIVIWKVSDSENGGWKDAAMCKWW